MVRFVNNLKTTILLAAIIGLAMGIGSIWGTRGLLVGFAFGGIMNIVAFFFSDKIALATMGARQVSPAEAPELHRMVEALSARAGIPVPRVYASPQQAPNAFATGRSPSHAAVCVTTGLLQLLSPAEVRAVLAHEIAHIKHRDTLISTIAATVAGAITMVAYMAWFIPVRGGDGQGGNPLASLFLILVAPIAATIIQLAISRSREYAADHRGGELHGEPLDLAHALVKLDGYARRIPMRFSRTHENMYIVQPFSGGRAASLFSTHPPTAKRVAALEAQAQGR
ncbi:MAG TPA: protease HtpX [Planctomycetes bacterium]|nr:protease HtpX [Planctomycetota bacterium]